MKSARLSGGNLSRMWAQQNERERSIVWYMDGAGSRRIVTISLWKCAAGMPEMVRLALDQKRMASGQESVCGKGLCSSASTGASLQILQRASFAESVRRAQRKICERRLKRHSFATDAEERCSIPEYRCHATSRICS